MGGEPVVDQERVAVDERRDRGVASDHLLDEGARLAAQRLDEPVVEAVFRIEPRVRLVAAQMPQIQPMIGDGADEPLEAGVVDEAVGHGGDAGRIAQRATARRLITTGRSRPS